MNPEDLRPGDVLLYTGGGLFSKIIAFKTWHKVSHVEVYLGEGKSAASRDGQGVGIYPLRTKDLSQVMRPEGPFDLAAALKWMDVCEVKGLPYGWLDLLQFVGFNVDTKGIVCSPFATKLLRAGGVCVFNDEPAEKIAPFQFELSEELARVWSKK